MSDTGTWSYSLTADDVTAMGEGDESITITATDAAGNTSATTTKAISVDTVAPTAPTIADVTADNVINGAEQTTSLSGTAEANASVSVSLGGLTKALTADADGAWSYSLTADDVTAMGEGDESITISNSWTLMLRVIHQRPRESISISEMIQSPRTNLADVTAM